MESNALALVASNDEVKISFNDNKMLYFSSNRKTIDRKTIQNLGDGFRFYGFKNIHEEIVSDVIKIHRISTFEQPIKTQSATQKHLEKIKTDLDIQIFELQRTYLSYQINLGKQVEQVFSKNVPIDIKTKREEIYGKKELFTQTINQFFAKTGKTIESDKSNEIVFRQNDKILTPYQLSSGEKQVLLILLSALIQDNKPYILIMDEPEISLHIDWQEQLIQVIRSLNENVQVILATHSPALVMKGWMDKVTEMEEITRQE
jgi:ABC-type glutathione transport system ATPase component